MNHGTYHVGLTGNIASGKSTVARLLVEHGATVIDADLLARDAIAPGTSGYDAVIDRFGEGVRAADGTLDRAALRKQVFNDPDARDALNRIVHPIVARLRDEAVLAARARGDRIVVSDVPLLFEVGLEHAFDAVLFVDAPDPLRLSRLVHNRGLSEKEARAMMAAQWPAAEKRARSTWVVDNAGSQEALAAHVGDIWRSIVAAADHLPVTSS